MFEWTASIVSHYKSELLSVKKLKEAADILYIMASYQIKTQRTQFHISSLYKKNYKHLAFVTEYSVSHSPDSPEMLNKEIY